MPDCHGDAEVGEDDPAVVAEQHVGGLTSRCSTPAPCAARSAATMPRPIRAASSGGSAPCPLITSPRVAEGTYSMTMHGRPSSSTTSCTTITWGWVIRAALRASRRVRSKRVGARRRTGAAGGALLHGDMAAEQLVVGPPDGAHTASADPFQEAVPAGDQPPRSDTVRSFPSPGRTVRGSTLARADEHSEGGVPVFYPARWRPGAGRTPGGRGDCPAARPLRRGRRTCGHGPTASRTALPTASPTPMPPPRAPAEEPARTPVRLPAYVLACGRSLEEPGGAQDVGAAVRAGGAARARRDGKGLPGRGPPVAPYRRREDPLRRAGAGARVPHPVPARGARRRRPQPPGCGHRARRGGGRRWRRRRALSGHGVRGRQNPQPRPQGRRAAGGPGGRPHGPGAGGPGAQPPARHRAPGHQTRERDAHRYGAGSRSSTSASPRR